MTRAQIVQRLLDEDKISAAEAVVLLTPEKSNNTQSYQPQRGTDNYWFTTSTNDNA